MIATRNMILEADDLPRKWVPCPEWGDGIGLWVRTLSGTERDAWETTLIPEEDQKSDLSNIRARFLVRTICDADGALMFTLTDADALGRKNSRALDRLFDAARQLSGMRREDVEELAGKTDAPQKGDSGFALPTSGECPSESHAN
jgi:hypothetical protein